MSRKGILLGLALLVGLGGCAPSTPPRLAVARPIQSGTILSMRAVSAQPALMPLRSALFAGAVENDNGTALMEFIVRADDGSTLSIVQPNDSKFRKGDRVTIERGEQTRLARPG